MIYNYWVFDSGENLTSSGTMYTYDDSGDHSNLVTVQGFNTITDTVIDLQTLFNPNLTHYLVYQYLNNKFSPYDTQSDWNQSTNTSSDYIKNKPSILTSSLVKSLFSAGAGLDYNSTTGVFTNTAQATSPTINNNVSRSLSDSTGTTNQFTISTTQNARVNYSITINWSVTALLSSTGTVYLEYSTNGGSTWSTVSQVTSTVNLGLTLSGSNDMNLSGEIPANTLVRLRTTTTNATCTYVRGQEILY